MSQFDESFDAKEWIRTHGLPQQGREFTLHLDTSHLGATIQIPSCASWNFPDLGVGQGPWDQHKGYRGTLHDFLEKARMDVERNQGMYGEASKRLFEGVLSRIDAILHSDDSGAIETVSLDVRDPSGLSGVPAELLSCIANNTKFERSAAESMMLMPTDYADDPWQEKNAPVQQLKSVEDIAELVRRAKSVVALTGAGISVESGITPFRKGDPSDDKGSIWGTFSAERMTTQNFNTDPDVAKEWWDCKRSLLKEMETAVPNSAHKFFAMLEQMGKLRAVVTQNIDSLHQKAGVSAEKVIELHGHMRGLICSDHKTALNPVPFRSGNCTFCIPADDVDTLAAIYKDEDKVPTCPECGCPLRTETVMFGQPMPLWETDVAFRAIDDADLLFVIGSTLVVQPANELPRVALQNRAPVVMINFDNTQYDNYVKGLVRQRAGEFLGAVADELKRMPASAAPAGPLRPVHQAPANSTKSTPHDLKRKRINKEGRRVAMERSVNARGCGIDFFCVAVAEPQGDVECLEQSLAAMNDECPDLGKMVFSDGTEQLVVLAFVPNAHAGVVNPEAWLQGVAKAVGVKVFECHGWKEEKGAMAKLVVPAGPDAFPIKIKEPGITAAIQFLKDKGLWTDADDDDIIYGDHDFPS